MAAPSQRPLLERAVKTPEARRTFGNAPGILLAWPDLWGPDLLFARSAAMRLLAEANREQGQLHLPYRQRRYGVAKAIPWTTYRCRWLYSRTALRDVEPDEIIQVRPISAGDRLGTRRDGYLVHQRWLYRRDFMSMQDLENRIAAFYRALLADSRAALGLAPLDGPQGGEQAA